MAFVQRKTSQENEDFMDGLNIFEGNNIENEDLNLNNINKIGINIENENKKINEEISNKKTKSKSKTKKIEKLSTKNITNTIKTKNDIRDETIRNTTLLDLENNDITLSQLIKVREEEEERKNSNIIEYDNDNDKSCEEEKNNKLYEKEENDSFSLSEEDEEIKKQRILAIEKITKKTDELVEVPGFNIYDFSKAIMYEQEEYIQIGKEKK